jgi:cell division protein FtsB
MVVGTSVQGQVTTIQPPATPGGPVVVTQTQMPAGVPTSRAEYLALIDKRGELSNQLQSAAGRRADLAEQLKTADPAARAGIQARMKVLDDRIVKLETEIDRTGDLVANTPPMVMRTTSTSVPNFPARIGREIIPITAILSVFVLGPLAIAVARLIWRRASAPERPALTDAGTQRQLEQMQQSIDAIAIEVERISENQRYVTRVMADRSIGSGPADPLRAGLQSALPVERG